MTTRHDPDYTISAWLQGEAVDGAPEHLVAATRSRISATQQRGATLSWRAVGRLSGRGRLAVAMVAAVAVAVAGLNLLPRLGGDIGQSPQPTSSADASPGVTSAPPTPDLTPEVPSLDLTWTEVDIEAGFGRIAWLDDRFVLVDSSGTVRTSVDGLTWGVLQPGAPDPGYADLLGAYASLVTWENDIVGWWNPEDGHETAGKPPITARDVLMIVEPPDQPTVTTPFEGRIQWMAVGPAGFIARTDFWPDEHTKEEAVWFSPDGIEWTAIPSGLNEVVGVSNGFIARGQGLEACTLTDSCNWMWHSSDGLDWRNLGPADPATSPARLVPWDGGALLTDGIRRFDFWTSEGYRKLPVGADFAALSGGTDPTDAPFAIGPLGLVSIRLDNLESLVTRDGTDWKVQPIPAAMLTDSDYNLRPNIAVGDRSVAYLSWSGYWGEGEGYIPTLWVGSVEP